jgi:hypothetical protein
MKYLIFEAYRLLRACGSPDSLFRTGLRNAKDVLDELSKHFPVNE